MMLIKLDPYIPDNEPTSNLYPRPLLARSRRGLRLHDEHQGNEEDYQYD